MNGSSIRVYAAYGMAACDAQFLESSLASYCSALALAGKPLTYAQHLELQEKYDKRTLGQLLKNAEDLVPLVHNQLGVALELLPKALEYRNFLAHRFFLEYVLQWETASGRNQMIDKCKEMSLIFQTAAEGLNIITNGIMRKFGLTDEMLAEAKRKLEQQSREVH